ncbi:hypothetical protein FKM82_025445 [Ascaphus truei]
MHTPTTLRHTSYTFHIHPQTAGTPFYSTHTTFIPLSQLYTQHSPPFSYPTQSHHALLPAQISCTPPPFFPRPPCCTHTTCQQHGTRSV